MRYKKLISLISTLLIAAILLTGCGAQKHDVSNDLIYGDTFYGDSLESNGSASMDKFEPGNNKVESTDQADKDQTDTEQYLATQKLIYSCDIELETLTFAETIANIKSLIKQFDGFVESDYVSDNSWNWYYEDYQKYNGTLSERIVIRVPTEHYETFLNQLAGQGKVMSKSERVMNITQSYNDTATTIAALEKEEAMLLAMMDKCTTIAEMITVETRLSDVGQQLALYKNKLNDMDVDVAFSTITISIDEVVEYTQVIENNATFIEKVIKAIKDSGKSFAGVASDLVIFLIFALPYLAIAIVIVFIVRRVIKKKKMKACAISTCIDNQQSKTAEDFSESTKK